MHYEHEGISLWYGTSDAPAPEGAVDAGTGISATIAVQPVDASNKVTVFYRVNQGPIETLAARWLQHDHTNKIQYFRAHFPAFRVGDTVEYTAVCHCAGRQVPDHAEAQQLRSSFNIVTAEPKSTSSSTVKEAHMHKAIDTSGSGMSASSAMHVVPQQMPASVEPLHAQASQTPMQNGTTQAALTQTPPATMPRTVIGNEHKAALGALLATSPALAHPELPDKLLDLYAEHQGPMDEFWQKLPEHPDFKEPGKVEQLQLTLQLGIVTQHHLPLINALQGLHQQGTLQSAHDLTKLDANGWTKLINSAGGGSVPLHIPGVAQEEKVANYVSSITDTLHSAFPTSYVAQNIAKSPEIDLGLVRNLLAQNPHIQPEHTLPCKLNWAGMSEADQEKAKASMETLRQEIKLFPGFDYKTALAYPVFQNPKRGAISQFFGNAPDFDFRTAHVDTYLAAHEETALKGIDPQHKAAIATQLKMMQRVFQVAPAPEHMKTLLGEGLHSAHSIASIPQATFMKQFSNKLGGEAQASAIQAQALDINGQTMHIFTQVYQAVNDVVPRAIGSTQEVLDTIKQIPNWPSLFRSIDFCDCEHCSSVYSPAAYFVDLLQFLNKSLPSGGRTPQQILFDRRPDLQYIKLSCENTNTLIPYLDLVNEILESYLAFSTTFDPAIANDPIHPTADELSANPQHINEIAYTMLQGAIYPFSLPFNRSLEVARVYLGHLGSSRYEILKTFQKNSHTPSTPISTMDFATQLACEYLKISPEECNILITVSESPWKFYGYIADQVYIGPPRDLGLGPDSGGGIIDVPFPIDPNNYEPWETHIAHVPEFLKQTGITYLDLIELVQTRFLNPEKKITLDTHEGADPCNLGNVTLKNLDDGFLKKAYRFLRLWRRLGWQIRDLDRVIQALEAADIDGSFLQNLAQVEQFQSDLNTPLVQVLSLWAKIDTEGDDSLYNKLFQNKAVIHPADPTFSVFALNENGSELKTVSAKIVDYVPVLLASLRITAADWASLWGALTSAKMHDDTTPTGVLGEDSLINLANLSTFYSYTVLAKALKLSMKDLLVLKVLMMKDPFTTVSLASTIEFIGKVRKVHRSGFSVAQLNYLYRHLHEPNRGIAPLQGNVGLLFNAVQDGLKKVANDNSVVPDPTGDLLRRKLSVLLDKGFIDAAMKLIDGSSSATQADQAQFIDDHFAVFFDAPESKTSTAEAKTKLLGASSLSKKEERFAYVLTPLMDYLRVSLSQAFVKQTLGDALKLDMAMTDVLLGKVLKARTAISKTAMADFLALVGDGLSATYFDKQDFTGTTVTRIDPTVNFDWSKESPDPAINNSAFSARWNGKVLAQYDETYTFYIRTSDGIRLWVDNQSLIDGGPNQSSTEHSGTIVLKAGQLYDLKMEYSHNQSAASVQLRWSSRSTPKTIIPQSQLYSGTTLTSFDQPLQSYYLLYKVAMLINTFKMTVKEVTYLSVHGHDFADFDFNMLPLDPSGFTMALFDQWERLADFFTLRNSLPQGEVGLTDVFQAATLDDLKSKLYSATNWDSIQIDDLSDPTNGFNLTTVDDFRKVQTLSRLQTCLALSKRLGVSIKHLFDWATKAPNTSQAQEIKNTVKAKYDDQHWLTVAKSLNDGLRESQRTALIAYLLQTAYLQYHHVDDSNKLYEYFLIDVDMSACMMTSRIVQAISTVQLFVQRCLMNLEPDVSPDAIHEDQWMWMKRYRMWEANRKVFINPENWIEPELRDDKSPFFKEMETELLKSDVTMDTAEQAFLNYLEKLDQVSRLEICGMYWEEEVNKQEVPAEQMDWGDLPGLNAAEVNILHVFGRTRAIPHIYYYRQFINNTFWTPWVKVNVDIEGDHLIPVVWNRELYIFWPIFSEKSDQDKQGLTNQDQGMPPTKHLEIKLAWSEYKNGKWSPKHISTESMDTSIAFDQSLHIPESKLKEINSIINSLFLQRDMHVFKAQIDDNGNLVIRDVLHILEFLEFLDPQTGFPFFGEVDVLNILEFHFTGCHGKINTNRNVIVTLIPPGPPRMGIVTPESSNPKFMQFVEDSTPKVKELTLFAGAFRNSLLVDWTTFQQEKISVRALGYTPSRYSILYPHQFSQFAVQAPFFYQDDKRTYFVTSEYPVNIVFPPPIFGPGNVVSSSANDLAATKVVSVTQSDLRTPELVNPPSMVERGITVSNPELLRTLSMSESVQTHALARPVTNGLRMMKILPSAEIANAGFVASPPPAIAEAGTIIGQPIPVFTIYLRFTIYFHPHVCNFIRSLNRQGIPGLLTLENQQRSDSKLYLHPGEPPVLLIPKFKQEYKPSFHAKGPWPAEDVDFSYSGSYSLYNWELFFHTPMLIASKLSKNQRFEEAQKWFHYIFNPTASSDTKPPLRYWNILPFMSTENERIQDLLALLDYTGNDRETLDRQEEVKKQVQTWRSNAFQPHVIARLRLSAYQKNVVMKYIDNLIAWGDQLFRQDTIELINEATQLYILAYDILGPRPQQAPARSTKGNVSYYDLVHDPDHKLDDFSNTLVTLENEFPFSSTPSSSSNGSGAPKSLGSITMPLFCIPQNDKLLEYWDTVADRLFKIRHCMNIEGVVRQLPLFAPPIDPALLVRAAAMGVDLSSVLNDINAAIPHYRFTYMLQKAMELCNDVKSLGASLLAALEKKDAEALAMLRATQETSLLKAVREVKKQQLDEANANIEALQRSLDVTDFRDTHYINLIKNPRSAHENQQIKELNQAQTFQEISQVTEFLTAGLSLIPNADLGISGVASPVVTATFGGSNIAGATQSMSRAMSFISSLHTYNANMASIVGGWDRRLEEWQLQEGLASREHTQIEQQIAAATIRASIAQLELDNHDKQIDNATAVEDFLRDKYTNQDLYDWMVGQISAVYFQCYQMAYDIAKRTERAYRFERGLTTSDFIKFGYWDSLKKGLLAGEQLYLDLKRLEMAYIDQNKREYEITKHISLVLFDPMALIALKETGECQVSLPEALFDMDYPGHYMRRIKSVSLTIPCVTGPYTNINCTLTLLRSKIRINSDNPESYLEQDDDPRFVTNFSAIESIATSTAQNDSGMFEVNFRDERYLPFEGAGVVSTWCIDMPQDCNAFDFETISDVIIRLNYTAREGGASLAKEAKKAAQLPKSPTQSTTTSETHFPDQSNLTRLFSAKHEFSSEWYRFLHPNNTADRQALPLDISIERFPFQYRGMTIQISQIDLFLKFKQKADIDPDTYCGATLRMYLLPPSWSNPDWQPDPNDPSVPPNGTLSSDSYQIPHATIKLNAAQSSGSWALEILDQDIKGLPSALQSSVAAGTTTHYRLIPDTIEDIFIVCQYSASDKAKSH